MAPISLAILNPISFVLMEINKKHNLTRDEEATLTESSNMYTNVSIHKQRCKMVLVIVKNIFFNPIILMTTLGILGNFIFQHNVPLYLAEVLNVSN